MDNSSSSLQTLGLQSAQLLTRSVLLESNGIRSFLRHISCRNSNYVVVPSLVVVVVILLLKIGFAGATKFLNCGVM